MSFFQVLVSSKNACKCKGRLGQVLYIIGFVLYYFIAPVPVLVNALTCQEHYSESTAVVMYTAVILSFAGFMVFGIVYGVVLAVKACKKGSGRVDGVSLNHQPYVQVTQ